MAYIFLDESGDLGFNFSKKKTSESYYNIIKEKIVEENSLFP